MEVTLLAKEQIFGEKRLKIFDEYGTKARITDFAKLLGGYATSGQLQHTSDGKQINNCIGEWWLKDWSIENWCTSIVCFNGKLAEFYCDFQNRALGIRPTLPYSLISEICLNKVIINDKILEIEYGEYPQYIVPKGFSRFLESAYSKRLLNKTEKKYITDSVDVNYYNVPFKERIHIEYEYNRKRYIRVKANFSYNENKKLSNGEKYKNGDYVWVEVSPIKWLVDIEKDTALSKNILISGIQFDSNEMYEGDLEGTFIYKYLNTHFINDIQIKQKEIEISVIEEKSERELALEKLKKDKQKILNLKRNLVNKR